MTLNKEKEKERLESISKEVDYSEGATGKIITFFTRAASEHYKGNSCLVMGPSEDWEQEKILESYFKDIWAVDGTKGIIQNLEKRFPEHTFVHSLFEEMDLKKNFNVIIMMNILEHVYSPVKVLQRAKSHLKDNGTIVINVPNAYSVHRMLGVKMGLLDDVHQLNESDKKVGHRRVYDSEILEKDIEKAGLNIKEKGGVFFKPFHKAKMEELTDEQLEGLFKLGEEFPENCASIMMVCEK